MLDVLREVEVDSEVLCDVDEVEIEVEVLLDVEEEVLEVLMDVE